MLHIGHFSYDELDENASPRHGYFTCVVNAENPKEALKAFAKYILRMKRSDFFFANVVKVYVDDIVKIPGIPSSPMTTLVQSSTGEFPETISYSLPFACPEGVLAYGLLSNVSRHETDVTDTYLESEAFIEFRIRTQQRDRAAMARAGEAGTGRLEK
jgi:hypothetical protein